MSSLSDTQCILLSSATQRDTGSLFPLPTAIKPGGGAAKAIAALVRRGLAEERETGDRAEISRADGDIRYGMFITAAGAAAIGVEPTVEPAAATPLATPEAPSLAPRSSSKVATVLDLLTRPDGATPAELIAATGWLPHTTRAALTGLRKKGHAVVRGKRAGITCYHIQKNA